VRFIKRNDEIDAGDLTSEAGVVVDSCDRVSLTAIVWQQTLRYAEVESAVYCLTSLRECHLSRTEFTQRIIRYEREGMGPACGGPLHLCMRWAHCRYSHQGAVSYTGMSSCS
jgi:hypothetical protein